MPLAEEFQRVNEQIAFWQAYEPAVKCDLSCCAARTAQGLIFVDPIPLAQTALDELTGDDRPVAIILTNGNHARSAGDFRQKYSIPVIAHRDAIADLGITIDRAVDDLKQIADGIEVIEIAGAGAGEIALFFQPSTLVIGDALIHLEPHGLAFLPDKYCSDSKSMRADLRKLLRFNFEVMTFAHGLPLVSHARPKFESLFA